MYHDRRNFIKKSTMAVMGTGAAFLFPMELLAEIRKTGDPNDRINVGLIGCNACSEGYAYLCIMGKYKKLSHVIYKCEYRIVWVTKYRFQILKGEIKDLVEKDVRLLCEWKSCEIQELNVQEDHIHF